MENKITLQGLAAMLALATGKQKDLCEAFVSELFSIVAEELSKGESIRIKGLGTFKLVEVEPRKSVNVATGEDYEIPGHRKVVFVMAKELASLVNAPFGSFEAVEIADALPTDGLDGDVEVPENMVMAETPEEIVDTESAEKESLEDQETSEDTETLESSEVIGVAEIEESHKDDTVSDSEETQGKEAPEEDETPEGDASDGEDDALYEDGGPSFWKRYKFIIGFTAGVCASLLIGWLAISLADYVKPAKDAERVEDATEELKVEEVADVFDEDSFTVAIDTVVSADQAVKAAGETHSDAVPTQPSDAPVYDTVTTTRYLTTIAQEHYGNFNLWPIIYEENAAILGHPDRIKPGTKVVVPPLSKYGINPKDKAQIKEVKNKGKAIYSKFK